MTVQERRQKDCKAQRKYRASIFGRKMIRKRRGTLRYKRLHRKYQVRYQQRMKATVLAHYGKGGKPMCCWRGCTVIDLDMLSLDHINNDGSKDSRNRGSGRYRILIQENFPKGFQTLCMNHQWKKHMLNTRKDITI